MSGSNLRVRQTLLGSAVLFGMLAHLEVDILLVTFKW